MATTTVNHSMGLMPVGGSGDQMLKPSRLRPPRPRSMSYGPSTSASIPSQYQTFFYSNNENKGFNSKSTRFQETQETIEDNPGPGTYMSELDSFPDKSSSFSKRGTGGFASKKERFSRTRHQKLGPGSYTPRIDSHSDFNKAKVSGNFHSPIAVKVEQGHLAPAPNSYNVEGINTGKNNLITAQAAFKSRTHRDIVNAHSINTPAPDQYRVTDCILHPSTCSYKSVFKSKSNRVLIKPQKGPGPADYSPHTNKQQQKVHRHKHYLCFSAPALPLPPIPPSPGPGHYDCQDEVIKAIDKNVVAFKSTSSRWMQNSNPNSITEPGPGSYYPVTDGKRSYLYNVHNKWV